MSEITKCPHCNAWWNDNGIGSEICLDRSAYHRTPACYERELNRRERQIARLHKMLMGDNEGALLLSDLTETAKTQQAKIAALESALGDLLEEYENQKCQFGSDAIWQKYEDKEAVAKAKDALK